MERLVLARAILVAILRPRVGGSPTARYAAQARRRLVRGSARRSARKAICSATTAGSPRLRVPGALEPRDLPVRRRDARVREPESQPLRTRRDVANDRRPLLGGASLRCCGCGRGEAPTGAEGSAASRRGRLLPVLRHPGGRQGEAERASPARAALGPQSSTVRLDDAFGDIQARGRYRRAGCGSPASNGRRGAEAHR